VGARRAQGRAIEASEPAWAEYRRDPAVEAAEALCAYAHAVDKAIHVEARISRFLPFWADGSTGFDLEGCRSLGLALLDELEATGGTDALITLRGLAAVADPWLGEPAREAAQRAARGTFLPMWADQIGRARPTAAHALTDPEAGDEIAVLIDFDYPDGEPHAISTFITDRLGGVAKHIGLTTPIDDAAEDGLAFDPMDLDEAKARMRAALEITPPDGVPGGSGHFELGALAWSRVRS
jgi:hypothetical protein